MKCQDQSNLADARQRVVGLRGCLRTCCRLRASAPPPLPVICELKCSDMAFFISVDCEYVAGVWKTTFMYTPLSM